MNAALLLMLPLVNPPVTVTFSGSDPAYVSIDGTYRVMVGATVTLPGRATFALERVQPNYYIGELRYRDGARMRYQKFLPATNGAMLARPYRGPPADPINGPPMIEWIAGEGGEHPSTWPGVMLQ